MGGGGELGTWQVESLDHVAFAPPTCRLVNDVISLISREYASILPGITNTVGAVPGIVGIALTGYLLDTTHSWSISLFAPSFFFYLTGTAVWLAFASSEPQEFTKSELES